MTDLSTLIEILTSFLFYNWKSILIFLFTVYIYKRLTWNHDFWRKRGIPGPTPLPFFGNALETLYKNSSDIEHERLKKYGRVYGFFEKNQPILSIGDPVILKKVLVRDFNHFVNRRFTVLEGLLSKMMTVLKDDEWRQVRSIASSAFTSTKLKRMTDLITTCIDSVMDDLDVYAKENEEFDLRVLFGKYSMDVIATCGFSTKTRPEKDNPHLKHPLVEQADDFFRPTLWRYFLMLTVPPFLRNLFQLSVMKAAAVKFFVTTLQRLYRGRKVQDNRYSDFLQLLIDAVVTDSQTFAEEIKDINEGAIMNEDEEDIRSNSINLVKSATTSNTKSRKILDEEETIAQCVVMLLAGYETSKTVLSLITHNLVLHPETQERVYQEIKAYYDKNGLFRADSNNRSELPYLMAVIDETLRLDTVVVLLERECGVDYVFEDLNNIKIPKGTLVRVPLNTLHTDEKFFDNPFKFDPDRFLPENLNKIKPYTYLPFGAGPRICVGLRFALLELRLVLFRFLLNYKLVPSENTKENVHIDNVPYPFLKYTEPIKCRVVKRQEKILS